MTSILLVLVLLSQAGQADSTSGGAMPPPHPAYSVEGYAQLTPMLVVDGGEALGINLGAPVRLRLAGGVVGAGLVRREDWDSLSDWGQLVHALKLGSDTSPVGLWVGALEGYSLLSGHLVRRYYELGRLRAVGSPALPQAQAPFPEGFSTYAEALVAWDGVRLGGLLQRHLSLSLGAEVFAWGRVDVDGRLMAQLAHRNLEVALSGLALGLGQPGARHLYSGQVRWRFGQKLYALAEGGTLLYPQPDGALSPGAFASLGLGVDNAR